MTRKIKASKPPSEPQNYLDWLENLVVGDNVKVSSCNHHRCNCSTIVVSGITEMFGTRAITVQDGCRTRYYSGVNGRELGSRKNTYRDGNISPFTAKDQEALDKRKAAEEEDALKRELSETLHKLMTGKSDEGSLSYHLRNSLSVERMKHLTTLLKKKD